MPIVEAKGLRFFQFASLSDHNLEHAILTRRGGVSAAPWDSLNMSKTVGDSEERVMENMRRGLRSIRCKLDSVFDVWQVHSAEVVTAENPNRAGGWTKADAIISDRPGVTLMMRYADCVPILCYDPVRHAVGIAHSGWLGTVRGIAGSLVDHMRAAYGTKPEDLIAGVGPSIGPDHYPVGPDVIEQVRGAFGASSSRLLLPSNGLVHFDLWSANRAHLEALGVGAVEMSEICTACNLDDWYSHRGESGKTGRFGAVIALQA